ncbi:MAG: aminotransferase class V-fold PLP-dependent enzyme [Clostridia bacterium]|nr:aminotransferase class V-fold PLP-dependent enzyme [Clostridia bacterium]
MNTPIWDFVRSYATADPLRLHMPGHKGKGMLGAESLDITEIGGADSLFEAHGIIAESEQNASALFGARAFYSTEGSSLALRAMLHLACLFAKEQGRAPCIAAGRNAHKVFLSAAALLDFDHLWLTCEESDSYLTCTVTPESLDADLSAHPEVTAVYLTSPDYLGNRLPLGKLAAVCHKHGCLCLVDNAHGAYLKFLSPSVHPMDLGVDMCCDSAHKTLPVLTGGAYLHISPSAPAALSAWAKDALALFASTSPSYLILQSLDLANKTISEGYGESIRRFALDAEEAAKDVRWFGYDLRDNEPLKWTIYTKSYGYYGTELAEQLEKRGIVCEFADPDTLVLMLTPSLGTEALERIKDALKTLPERAPILQSPPKVIAHEQGMTVRQAMLSPSELLPISQCVGRILASPSVGCPPAVPLVVCGQRITEADFDAFRYYGIETCAVVVG